MNAAQVDAHGFGLRRELLVHVGQRFGVVACRVVGFRQHIEFVCQLDFRLCLDFFRLIVGFRLIDFAQQILPVFRLTERKVDLCGFEFRWVVARLDRHH